MRKKGKCTMKDGSRRFDEQCRQQALRGLKKKALRALSEMPPMSDDEVREALRRFSSILRESGMTGSGSPAAEYRECSRRTAAVKN
jgi:hypothetical protein